MYTQQKYQSGLYRCVVMTISFLVSGLSAISCKQPSPSQPQVPPTVVAKRVMKADGARELRLSGSLSAKRSIALSFATIGTVEKVKVQEGQAVKQGQLLAVVSAQSYKDALKIAQVKAKQAEDAYRRLLPMYKNKTLAEVKMVEVETGSEQAKLAVSMAQQKVRDTELRAPLPGIVANRNVEPGMNVTPGIPAFTLVQTDIMMATAPVPEMQVAKIRHGVTVTVKVPAVGKTTKGEVREIAVAANPLTRTYDIEVVIPNPDGDLRMGMIADLYLNINESDEEMLTVPPEAIRVTEKGAPYVFVVTPEKKVQRRLVTVARFVGEVTALSKGVREGELVVTSGTPMLADGLTVNLQVPDKVVVQ